MLVITIEGGLVQGVSSDDPAEIGREVIVIDYDAEGAEPEEVHRIPQGKGETQDATIDRKEVGVLYKPIARYLRTKA